MSQRLAYETSVSTPDQRQNKGKIAFYFLCNSSISGFICVCSFTWWNVSRAASQNWVRQWRKVKCSVDTCNTCVHSRTHGHFFCTPALQTYASNLSVTRWNTLDLLWISWNTQAHCKARWGDVVNHLSSALTEVEGLNLHTWSCFVGNICSLSPGWCNQGGGDVSGWLHTCSHTHKVMSHWCNKALLSRLCRPESLLSEMSFSSTSCCCSEVSRQSAAVTTATCQVSQHALQVLQPLHAWLKAVTHGWTWSRWPEHTHAPTSHEKKRLGTNTHWLLAEQIFETECVQFDFCCIFFLLLWWHWSFS